MAAVALAWIAGRALQSWGRSRLWGLIVLMDPGIVLLSRTAMADVGLALFAVGYVSVAQHLRNAGAFYTYVAAGLGKPFGVGASAVKIWPHRSQRSFWSWYTVAASGGCPVVRTSTAGVFS